MVFFRAPHKYRTIKLSLRGGECESVVYWTNTHNACEPFRVQYATVAGCIIYPSFSEIERKSSDFGRIRRDLHGIEPRWVCWGAFSSPLGHSGPGFGLAGAWNSPAPVIRRTSVFMSKKYSNAETGLGLVRALEKRARYTKAN